MTLTPARTLIFLAAAGSAAMLLSAWGFQYLGGLAPCAMCIWQRWPHGVAALAGALGVLNAPLAAVVGLCASLVGTGIAVFHSGVERDLWDGPTTCTSNTNVGGMSAEELLSQILDAPVVRCDEIPWELLGLSMANWNGIVSLGFVCVWGLALKRSLRGA
jgi:disulfide bond formation protein DsbB